MPNSTPDKKRVTCWWGFPVMPHGESATYPPSVRGKRGISLLIAITTIATMITMVADLIVTSSVNLELASRTRDEVRSEYVAKSAFNLALFLITGAYAIELKKATLPPPIGGGPLTDDASSTWQIMNDLPPLGADMVRILKAGKKPEGKKLKKGEAEEDPDPFHLSGVLNEKLADQMSLLEDQFSIKVTDEAGKINISNLINLRAGKATLGRLVDLFSCPAEKEFLQSKGLQPEELAYRIFDFIRLSADDTASPESGFNSRNDPYSDAKPPYKTKSLPLDSVKELRLVKGWDGEVDAVFSRYLTSYPYLKGESVKETHKINLNTAPIELMSCLFPTVQKDECQETYLRKRTQMQEDKSAVIGKDLKTTLKEVFCYTAEENPDLTKAADGGAELTPDQWLTDKTTVLRVAVEVKTGSQYRTLTAVVRRIAPQDKEFLRDKQDIKRSYEILSFELQ